jgi:hypothetical protein
VVTGGIGQGLTVTVGLTCKGYYYCPGNHGQNGDFTPINGDLMAILMV